MLGVVLASVDRRVGVSRRFPGGAMFELSLEYVRAS